MLRDFLTHGSLEPTTCGACLEPPAAHTTRAFMLQVCRLATQLCILQPFAHGWAEGHSHERARARREGRCVACAPERAARKREDGAKRLLKSARRKATPYAREARRRRSLRRRLGPPETVLRVYFCSGCVRCNNNEPFTPTTKDTNSTPGKGESHQASLPQPTSCTCTSTSHNSPCALLHSHVFIFPVPPCLKVGGWGRLRGEFNIVRTNASMISAASIHTKHNCLPKSTPREKPQSTEHQGRRLTNCLCSQVASAWTLLNP